MKEKKTNILIVILCILGLGGGISLIGKSLKTTKTLKLARQFDNTKHLLKSEKTTFQKIKTPIDTARNINSGFNSYNTTQEIKGNLTPEEEVELEALELELLRRESTK
jgi:hypothetical protein